MRDDFSLLSRAFKNQFIIPEFEYFCDKIENIYYRCKENEQGQVVTLDSSR